MIFGCVLSDDTQRLYEQMIGFVSNRELTICNRGEVCGGLENRGEV
jgi:hypothetical protein